MKVGKALSLELGFIILLFILILQTILVGAETTTYVDESFNSGTLPTTNWGYKTTSAIGATGTISITNFPSATDKSLTIARTSTTQADVLQAYMTNIGATPTIGEVVVINFKTRFTATSANAGGIMIYDESGTLLLNFYFTNKTGGTYPKGISVRGAGSTWVSALSTLDVNKFYDISTVINFDTDQFDVYIDGIEKISQMSVRTLNKTKFNQIRFDQDYTATQGIFYLNEFKVIVGNIVSPIIENLVITGNANLNNTLTSSYTAEAENSTTYQWMACDTQNGTYSNLQNKISKTLNITEDLVGKYIKVKATPKNIFTYEIGATVTSSAIGPITANNNAPTSVTLTYPRSDATYEISDTVILKSFAIDLDNDIRKVEYYDGNTKIGESSTAPYISSFVISEGEHSISAKAIDEHSEFVWSTLVQISPIQATNKLWQTIFSEDFNSYNNNVSPYPATFDASLKNDGTIVSENGKVKMGITTGINTYIGRVISPTISLNIGFETEITIENNKHKRDVFMIRKQVGTSGQFGTIAVIINGSLYLNDSTDDAQKTFIQTLTPGIPYVIKASLDVTKRFVDLYVDGAKKVSQGLLNYSSDITNIEQIRMAHWRNEDTMAGYTWIDNFKIYQIGIPPNIISSKIFDNLGNEITNLGLAPKNIKTCAISFDSDMSVASFSNSVTLESSSGTIPFIGEYSSSTKTYTLNLQQPLKYGETYTLSVKKGVKKTNYTTILSDYTKLFTIVDIPVKVTFTSLTYEGEANQAVVLENGKKLIANVSIKASAGMNTKVIAVLYNQDGKISDLKIESLTFNTISEQTTSNLITQLPQNISGYKYRILVWKLFDNLEPIYFSDMDILNTLSSSTYIVTNTFFPHWARKAVTFSYDDGVSDDVRLVSIFNENNVKGTFNLNSYRYTSETIQNIIPLYEGHEIASHSSNHPKLNLVTTQEAIQSVNLGRQDLEAVINKPVRGFAYPNGNPYVDTVTEIVKNSGAVYARPTTTTNNFNLPTDFMDWQPTCHHNDLTSKGDEFLALPDDGTMKLLSVWGHSYEFPYFPSRNQMTDKWYIIEDFCAKIKDRQDVWKATNIDVYDYIQAQKNLIITRNYISNPSSFDVYVEINGAKKVIKANEIFYFWKSS